MTTALQMESAHRVQTDAVGGIKKGKQSCTSIFFFLTGSFCTRNDERREQKIIELNTQGGYCLMA